MEVNAIGGSLIIEVEQCGKKEVLHIFEASVREGGSMLPCSGRQLPKACYVFFFTPVNMDSTTVSVVSSENSGFNYIPAVLAMLLAAVSFFYLRKRKKTAASNPGLIAIGQYRFDQKGMLLILEAQSVELSNKESDLLFLLASNRNKTLEREYILKEVWGDGGDYVGRTLDVFISKLRKKLEGDSAVKILNLRGIGYRFVISQ